MTDKQKRRLRKSLAKREKVIKKAAEVFKTNKALRNYFVKTGFLK